MREAYHAPADPQHDASPQNNDLDWRHSWTTLARAGGNRETGRQRPALSHCIPHHFSMEISMQMDHAPDGARKDNGIGPKNWLGQ